MSRILVVCNTPFQFVTATHVLSLYYEEYEWDLVISNQFKGSSNVVANAKKSQLFGNVYYVHTAVNKRRNAVLQFLDKIKSIIVSTYYAYKICRTCYDDVLFSNIQIFTKILTSAVKRKNQQARIHIVEEGLGTYSKLYAKSDDSDTLYRKYIDKQGIIAKLSTLYLFNPQFLEWEFPKEKTCKLPLLDAHNTSLMKVLNRLFDYEHCTDVYDRRIIFFEESYYAEGELVPDVEIVEEIASRVGKENIMIKVHPRNPVNRFKQLGYKTNTDSFVPWELIVLNQPMKDKIFVTIASGAAINPYLYMGLSINSYSLLNCLEHRPGIMNTSVGDIMIKAYETYPAVLKAPAQLNDFLQQLC